MKTKNQVQAALLMCVLVILILSGCAQTPPEDTKGEASGADTFGYTAPAQATVRANAQVLEALPFADKTDFENARKGFIATDDDLVVEGEDGQKIWSLPDFAFMKGEAPASTNPSLWRQEQLNNIHGLFKVTDGIYQVRGYDLANMTLISGKSGWIIVDPLTTKQTAVAAMSLVNRHLENRPVSAILFTHTHIDHFGGVLGVISSEQAADVGQIPVIAPKGFMEEATSENIIAGVAMARRSMFMYGKNLPKSPRAQIGVGLGKGPAYGAIGILTPTDLVDRTGQKMTIDGVAFEFQYTPASEAPAEMTFYLPEFQAFCGAEVVSCTLHNLYTLRGTKVRDAVKWSAYIDEAMTLFKDAKIYFGCHHWPLWGNEAIMDFLAGQRDTYKYIHDQTVRLFNQGYTPGEIADVIELPPVLAKRFSSRGYYGTVRHDSRAVYQFYLGWYDANPAHLNPLPETETAPRYVELMGGAEAVMKGAKAAFDQGQYRWSAELLNHLVFAEPSNEKAKDLLAAAYDQLGYQSESGAWRDAYLTGAYELRNGKPEKGIDMSILEEVFKKTPVSYFFDSMSVRLNGPKAWDKNMRIRVHFTDLDQTHELILVNGVLHHKDISGDLQKGGNGSSAAPGDLNAQIDVTQDLFVRMLIGKAGIKETIFGDDLHVSGSRMDLVRFLMLFDRPDGLFDIVTP